MLLLLLFETKAKNMYFYNNGVSQMANFGPYCIFLPHTYRKKSIKSHIHFISMNLIYLNSFRLKMPVFSHNPIKVETTYSFEILK